MLIAGARVGRSRINATMQAHILRALFEGPHTAKELVEVSGGGIVTIRAYIRALRLAKLVRVAEWHEAPNGALVVQAYMWAPDKTDARQPKKDALQRSREYKARKKAAKLLNLERRTNEVF